MEQVSINNRIFRPYITEAELDEISTALAARINEDYQGKEPLFISVLNGAFIFTADLFRKITVPSEITFIKVASYEGISSRGEVEEILGLERDLHNRHVIVVEDIVDTGVTMNQLKKIIGELSPASFEVATLLYKPNSIKIKVPIKYIGKEIGDEFVVGYGLDLDGKGRNLPAIYQLFEQ